MNELMLGWRDRPTRSLRVSMKCISWRVYREPNSLFISAVFARPASWFAQVSSSGSSMVSGKKQRTFFTDNTLGEPFEQYAQTLTAMHEKRERLVKASRDVTMNSKKVIFQVHRLNLESKESVLQQAEIDLARVKMDHVSRIAKELQGSDFWKFRRAYSPGMQEYVEAAAFLEFCKNGRLLTMEDLNESFKELKDASSSDFKLNLQDYFLGVGDLTGELMRLAISNVTDGQADSAKSICNFVRSMYVSLSLIANEVDDSWDMKQKMEVMLQSVMKIETTCYTIHVRGSEYFPGAAAEDIDSEQREEG